MSTAAKSITAEELWTLPGNQRRELVKGEVRTMAPAGFDHGAIIDNLHFLLSRHVRDHQLGQVLGAETGFRLSRNPDTVRAPDISFVTKQRMPASGRPEGYWDGPPDLAVEVVSPSDTADEVAEKVDDYITAGAALVWVVYPRRRTVMVHSSGANPIILRSGDLLAGDPVIPGFQCAVSAIFA